MKSAFSIIELLVAMTILIILIGVMTIIYNHTDKVWMSETGKADHSAAGQAALRMIERDLEHAVADELLTFAMRQDRFACKSYGFPNDEICFVSLQQDASSSNRTAAEVQYWVRQMPDSTDRYELVRSCCQVEVGLPTNAPENCYWDREWYEDSIIHDSNTSVVAENVAGLSFVAPGATGELVDDYESATQGDRLPEYVDVCLELMDETAAKQASQSWAASQTNATDFVERKSRRYTSRIYFHNRSGYRKRL